MIYFKNWITFYLYRGFAEIWPPHVTLTCQSFWICNNPDTSSEKPATHYVDETNHSISQRAGCTDSGLGEHSVNHSQRD